MHSIYKIVKRFPKRGDTRCNQFEIYTGGDIKRGLRLNEIFDEDAKVFWFGHPSSEHQLSLETFSLTKNLIC